MIRQSSASSRPNRLANRKASPFSKQSLAHAFRVMAPALFALTFGSIAHAQGTMNLSGAQTLMGTFKTFAVYAGAVICFGGLIFAGIRIMSGRFQDAIPPDSWQFGEPLALPILTIVATFDEISTSS